MKKTIKILTATAILAAIMLLTLTGCSSTPFEKYLNTNWDKSQKEVATYDYTYSVNEETKITGTLTTTIFDAKGKSFRVGSQEIKEADKGTFYESRLVTDNNGFTDEVLQQVYFKGYSNQNHRPVVSYTKRASKDKLIEYELTYSAKEVTAKVTINGETQTYKTNIKNKGLVYDNNELHAVLRAIDYNQKGSLLFQTPILERNNIYAKNVQMGMVQQVKYNVADENGVIADDKFKNINDGKEFKVAFAVIQSNDKPAGLPQGILIAIDKVKIDGVEFDQPILEITEGSQEKGLSMYKLKTMKKVEFNL